MNKVIDLETFVSFLETHKKVMQAEITKYGLTDEDKRVKMFKAAENTDPLVRIKAVSGVLDSIRLEARYEGSLAMLDYIISLLNDKKK